MSLLPLLATQPRPKRDGWRSGMAVCCCCFTGCVSMIITAAITLGIASLIIWLVLQPIHTSTYDLSDLTISKFAYTATSNRTMDVTANYTILSYNSNSKVSIKYSSISVDTSYQGEIFNRHSILRFYHGHKANATISGNFTKAGLVDAPTGVLLQADIAKQNVPLLIRVNVKARLKVGALTTPAVTVHVNCDVGIKPPILAVGASLAQLASVLRKLCKRV